MRQRRRPGSSRLRAALRRSTPRLQERGHPAQVIEERGHGWTEGVLLEWTAVNGLVDEAQLAECEGRKFNRTENVRPIPPEDPDFRGIFRRRNDAESINRALEDTLRLRRAHRRSHSAPEALEPPARCDGGLVAFG